VVIQDLLDSSELSIVNAITRMRLIAKSMLEDAVTALIENDDDIARDVIERDDDVDRLWLVVSRIFRATLRSPRAVEELGVSREACFDFHSSARQLERIADHAVKISDIARSNSTSFPPTWPTPSTDSTPKPQASSTSRWTRCSPTSPKRPPRLGHDALAAVLEIDEHTRQIDDKLRDLEPAQAQSLGLIVDSLSRSADYGGNIAETALQKAAPRPKSAAAPLEHSVQNRPKPVGRYSSRRTAVT